MNCDRKIKLRKLRFDQLEERTLLSISFPIDPSIVNVQGGTLTAPSIVCDTLTIGGASPKAGPSSGDNPVMDGGILQYSSDALPGVVAKNGAQLNCVDPQDPANAWRSTTVTPGGSSIQVPVDDNTTATRDFGPLTVYQNRFGQIIAAQQTYTDTVNGVTTTYESQLASVHDNGTSTVTVYAKDAVDSIIPGSDKLTVNTTGQGTVLTQQLATVAGATIAGVTGVV